MPVFTLPALRSEDKRWQIVNGTMRKNGFARHALIATLHTVQSSFGYFDDDSILNEPWGSSTGTRCGKCVPVCPTGALFDKSKIGSDHPKYPDYLPYLNMMREAQ